MSPSPKTVLIGHITMHRVARLRALAPACWCRLLLKTDGLQPTFILPHPLQLQLGPCLLVAVGCGRKATAMHAAPCPQTNPSTPPARCTALPPPCLRARVQAGNDMQAAQVASQEQLAALRQVRGGRVPVCCGMCGSVCLCGWGGGAMAGVGAAPSFRKPCQRVPTSEWRHCNVVV